MLTYYVYVCDRLVAVVEATPGWNHSLSKDSSITFKEQMVEVERQPRNLSQPMRFKMGV